MKEDVAKARYPKKAREPARLKATAVEIGLYVCNGIPGLLRTLERARALLECVGGTRMRRWQFERLLGTRWAESRR
ncbi:hypothetical protein ACIQ1J_34255 [Streptomyces sp. NPDC097107]|uniref:hypothetical protein n=1 Tax=Streptomyces sp. NPDC097107 TaxID=3366089 RepID=UPI00380E07CC